ncbi:hypothetical protein LINPERPRIM_LOCUS12985 [Linum perenne]
MIKVENTYRERKPATDFLASLGYDMSTSVHSISIYNPMLSHHLLYDFVGLSQLRLVMKEI